MEVVVRLAGAAGQGIQSLGEIWARSVFRSGLFVHGELSYHSRIRGTHFGTQRNAIRC